MSYVIAVAIMTFLFGILVGWLITEFIQSREYRRRQ